MQLNAIWVGRSLSYVEQACLSSALAVGHSLDLWAYAQIEGVPNGVRVRDAREVMPEEPMLIHHQRKSPAVGADIFRLLLQEQGRGCYIDADVLLLKPIEDEEHIFGYEHNNAVLKPPARDILNWMRSTSINNAVLKLPPRSPILRDILNLMRSKPFIAPWWSWQRKLKQRARFVLGQECDLGRTQWRTTGPHALSYFAAQNQLSHLAKHPKVFYALPSSDAAAIFDPPSAVDAYCTADTIAVHLSHSAIAGQIGDAPPAGSWIDEQCRRLGVSAACSITLTIQ